VPRGKAEGYIARLAGKEWLWPVLLIAGLIAVDGLTLLRYPQVHVDDAWAVSRVWGLLHTGQVYGTLDAGVFEHYHGYWTYFPWIATFIHVPFVALMGPTDVSVRVASLLFGALLLATVYVLGRGLGGAKAGLIAVLITGTSGAFVISSHLGRHDIIVAALGCLSIALYLNKWRTVKSAVAASVAAGLLIGFSLDIHPNALIYIPVLGCLVFLVDGWRAPLKPRFWAFGAGLIAGVGFFVLVHLSEYRDTYLQLFNISNGTARTPPSSTLNLEWWVSSVLETLRVLGPVLVVLVGLAAVSIAVRRTANTKYVVALLVVPILAFSAIVAIKQIHYTVLIVPMVAVFVGVGLEKFAVPPPIGGRAISDRMQMLAGAGLAAFLVAWPVQGLSLLLQDSHGDYDRVVAGLQEAVPASAVVMGSQIYWFGFTGTRYLSWEQLMYYQRAYPHTNTADALQALGVQYFIMDPSVARYSIPEPDNATPDLNSPETFQSTIRAYLEKNGRLTATIQSDSLGQVQVYRIGQDRPPASKLPAILVGFAAHEPPHHATR
jgi:4-amino-4-deoxy-L-arabinose transferase-like glycosyltransferase